MFTPFSIRQSLKIRVTTDRIYATIKPNTPENGGSWYEIPERGIVCTGLRLLKLLIKWVLRT